MCLPDLKIFMWSKALMLSLLHAGKVPLRKNSSTLPSSSRSAKCGSSTSEFGPWVLNPCLFDTHLRNDQSHTKGVRCASEAAGSFHRETKRGNVWREVKISTHRCLGTWWCRLVTQCRRTGSGSQVGLNMEVEAQGTIVTSKRAARTVRTTIVMIIPESSMYTTALYKGRSFSHLSIHPGRISGLQVHTGIVLPNTNRPVTTEVERVSESSNRVEHPCCSTGTDVSPQEGVTFSNGHTGTRTNGEPHQEETPLADLRPAAWV